MIRLVLFQPDIPQNLGACLRLGACLGADIHVIEPCGFPLNHSRLRRAGMDYIDHVRLITHLNMDKFLEYQRAHPGRLVLLETDGAAPYTTHRFAPSDYLMLGRESAGTPRALYSIAEGTLCIPMRPGMRSLNVAMAAGIVVAEACRQLGIAAPHDLG